MTQPALLLGYGARGEQAAMRTAALAYPSPIVRNPRSGEDLPEAIDEIATRVAGGSVVRVIHLLESDDIDARTRLAESARTAAQKVRSGQALNLVQFVIALVGRDWDEDELVVLDLLDGLIQDVLVVSRASHERALTSEEAEVGIASDLAYALTVSRLPDSLEPGMHWLTGASAIYYRREVLSAGITAFHLVNALEETLLSPLPAQHVECDLAQAWVKAQELGHGSHLDRLVRSPRGAAIPTEIQLDEGLFAGVRPEQLVDALRSFVQLKADALVKAAREQIARNRIEHLGPILEQLEREVWETLRTTARVASAERYVECAGEALLRPAERLALAVAEAKQLCEEDDDEMAALEEDLAAAIYRLPYPAAVVARSLGFGALGVWAYLFLQGLLDWDPNFTVISVLVGLVAMAPVLISYLRARARIAELRRRYLQLAIRRIRRLIALAVLEAAAESVTELRERAVGANDSLARKLKSLRTVLEELRDRCKLRIEDRVLGDLSTTEFSVFLPTPEAWPTRDLCQRFPLPAQFDLAGLLLADVMARQAWTAEELDSLMVAAVHEVLLPELWPNLGALLADSPSASKEGARVLGAVLAPLIRVGELVQAQSLRRFVTIGEGTLVGLTDVLATAGVEGRIATTDDDSVTHIAARAVASATHEQKGRHDQ